MAGLNLKIKKAGMNSTRPFPFDVNCIRHWGRTFIANTHRLRRLVQFAFAGVTVLIGVQFYLFVHQLETGAENPVSRPPGVEAFLPISSLMSLKYWLLSGDFNRIHPSGLLIFIFILITALLLKRGFCSWVCPFGLLSEVLARVHAWLFGRPRQIWRWLDYPLRSVKYLLLLFFLWAVLVQMDAAALEAFIYGPYNRVADIKMLKFFTEASALTVKVVIGLLLLSILFRFFWCRYLCPYGALLGLLSWLSPFKIRRNTESCIDCEKCTRACPAFIKVHRPRTVSSDECHACLQCVVACPVENTLQFQTRKRLVLRPALYAALILALFLFGSIAARFGGVWRNSIDVTEYRYHIRHLDDPEYYHNRGIQNE